MAWAGSSRNAAMILLIALPLMLAVAMIIYADRKIWAAMALRRGPNVVGPFGLLQSFADGLKVFLQETIIPSSANKGLFLLAPIITFTVALIVWAVIPFGGHGAGGHQCRAALHARGLVARRLRRDHGGLGVELEISLLLGDPRRGADGVVRSLDRLRADLGRAVGGQLQPRHHRRGAEGAHVFRQRFRPEPAAVPDGGGVLHLVAGGNRSARRSI
jgi:hypothetical protein